MENNELIINGTKFNLTKPLLGFKSEIIEKLKETNYNNNVFLMMKFRDTNHLISEAIISELSKHGLNCVRADMEDWNITDNVYNPVAVLYCCKYGIALFDLPEPEQNYSPNVAYELGFMHSQNKQCLILINESIVHKKPFDLLSNLHKTYKQELQIVKLVERWVKEMKIIPIAHHQMLRVVIGVIKHKNKFLLTKRKTKEKELVLSNKRYCSNDLFSVTLSNAKKTTNHTIIENRQKFFDTDSN